MKIAYFDAHCDTILRLLEEGGHLDHNNYHIAIDKTSHYQHYIQVFACFSDMGAKAEKELSAEEFNRQMKNGEIKNDDSVAEHFEALVNRFYSEMARSRDRIMPCRSAADIEKAIQLKKIGAILGAEGAEQIEKIGIDKAYGLGIRIVTLTWNYKNVYGGTCVTGGGLTEEGKRLVRRANELGVVIDVSHGSEELFWDVAATATKPFIASHSNSKALCGHRRNLTDEQFKELIKCGGVTGINLYSAFLAEGRQATIDDVVAHIDHFMELGGEKNIAMGGDLDGCEMIPVGMDGVHDVELIWEALSRKGYSGTTLRGIFFDNLLRVFKAQE